MQSSNSVEKDTNRLDRGSANMRKTFLEVKMRLSGMTYEVAQSPFLKIFCSFKKNELSYWQSTEPNTEISTWGTGSNIQAE